MAFIAYQFYRITAVQFSAGLTALTVSMWRLCGWPGAITKAAAADRRLQAEVTAPLSHGVGGSQP